LGQESEKERKKKMRLTEESLKNMITETIQEGYMDYIRAEEEALNKFKNVRSLRNQGKATMDDVQAAYKEYKAIKDNPEKFLSPQEIARDIADNERRNRESDAKAIARAEEEEAAEKRRREAEVATMMSTRRGYKDRGIDMGPGDPGDIDDLYPQLKEGFLYEGDNSILNLFEDATLEEGDLACGACLFEVLQEASCGCPDLQQEAEYRGRKVKLNKPMRGDVKKFKVYVKDPKTGNIKKVNFGDKNMRIKKSNPKRRKSFRARHNCKNPGPKTKARYWSCRKW
jgi:hypothetical protein